MMEDEIERLKTMQKSLKNKIKVTTNFDEKEMLQEQINGLQTQIDMLERFRSKTG